MSVSTMRDCVAFEYIDERATYHQPFLFHERLQRLLTLLRLLKRAIAKE